MSYDSEVAADTPAIYWKLQETSGTAATDSSGNARTGTYNGTPATNYALNQSVSLLGSDPTAKSVKFMRDSGTEGGWPTTRSNLSDGSTACGKASVSLAYASWNGMNVAGAAFSAETWFRVPSTLHRQASYYTMVLAARRASSPLQWQRCPLRDQAYPLLAFSACGGRSGEKFRKPDVELLEGLAGHVTLALVAPHRFAVEQWRIEQLTLVRRIAPDRQRTGPGKTDQSRHQADPAYL